jgi:aminoglycoside N3'-acetyltransferase
MTNSRWTESELEKSLDQMDLHDGDFVFIHSNLGISGSCERGIPEEVILRTIKARVGAEGCIFLPAFTYSIGQGQVFNPLLMVDKATMGALSGYAFQEKSPRSNDPMFSVIGIGTQVVDIFASQLNRSFGKGSLFSLLLEKQVKMISINTGAGGTIIHEMENVLAVPYRFEKTFEGRRIDPVTSRVEDVTWTSYVRDLSDPSSEADFLELTKRLYAKEIWKKWRLGKGYIAVASAGEVLDFLVQEIKTDPRLLTKDR